MIKIDVKMTAIEIFTILRKYFNKALQLTLLASLRKAIELIVI